MKPLTQALVGILIRRGNADIQKDTRNAHIQRKDKANQ